MLRGSGKRCGGQRDFNSSTLQSPVMAVPQRTLNWLYSVLTKVCNGYLD